MESGGRAKISAIAALLIAFVIGLVISETTASVTTDDNVVVLANTNSTTSMNIANYYKTLHPNVQIAQIDVPTSEVINIAQYVDLLEQVQDFLDTNGVIFSTHYLVTTKDLPLKIQGTNEFNPNTSTYSSVDSELTLAGVDFVLNPIAPTLSNTPGVLLNPYSEKTFLAFAGTNRFPTFRTAYESKKWKSRCATVDGARLLTGQEAFYFDTTGTDILMAERPGVVDRKRLNRNDRCIADSGRHTHVRCGRILAQGRQRSRQTRAGEYGSKTRPQGAG